MSQKKKIIYISIAISVIMLLTVGVTLAYLGANQKAVNTIKIGNDTAEISEIFEEPSKQTIQNITPKEVTVENTGNVPYFVRVYMEFSDSKVAELASVNNANNQVYYPWISDNTDTFKSLLEQESNTVAQDWQFIANKGAGDKIGGYFYYKKIVAPQEKTASLIKNVKVVYPEGIDYIQDYEMVIYTETIQTVEIDGTHYTDDDWRTAWERFLKVRN